MLFYHNRTVFSSFLFSPFKTLATMKQVIIRNIVNMEKYLVSEPEQQSHADLDVLSLESLWMLHDKLVWDMKDLIPEAQD